LAKRRSTAELKRPPLVTHENIKTFMNKTFADENGRRCLCSSVNPLTLTLTLTPIGGDRRAKEKITGVELEKSWREVLKRG